METLSNHAVVSLCAFGAGALLTKVRKDREIGTMEGFALYQKMQTVIDYQKGSIYDLKVENRDLKLVAAKKDKDTAPFVEPDDDDISVGTTESAMNPEKVARKAKRRKLVGKLSLNERLRAAGAKEKKRQESLKTRRSR